jgi:hypothetical protein
MQTCGMMIQTCGTMVIHVNNNFLDYYFYNAKIQNTKEGWLSLIYNFL